MTTPSTGLTSAHRGYAYQDLVVALRLLDMLTGRATEVRAELMLDPADRFDDVKTWHRDGRCTAVQIKHSTIERHFSIRSLANDSRGLRLDRLIHGILQVREAEDPRSLEFEFQLLTTDLRPSITGADAAFRLATIPGGDELHHGARAYQLDADEVLRLSRDGTLPEMGFAIADLQWALSQLWFLTEAPRFSADLSSPGAAEQILLRRVRDELGAGSYPNHRRLPEDVAAGLILAANAARTGALFPTRENLVGRLQLRTDYGAVVSSHPVVDALRVSREAVLQEMIEKVRTRSSDGGVVVITGPPGQGKSWLSDELESALETAGWLLSSHYCYINDVDSAREERTLIETIHGSLISGFAMRDSALVAANVPVLAATRETLEQTLRRAVLESPVALVVDGVDHITRVRGNNRGLDPSLAVCEALAAIDLPPGVVLIVLSQPGDHLSPFEGSEYAELPLPGMGHFEIEALVDRQLESELDEPFRGEVVEAVEARSAGNALYATYLCRELDSRALPQAAMSDAIRALPHFDGSLRGYYDHIYESLSFEAAFVADSLALVNFAVTAEELRQLLPRPRFVEEAMSALAPVLRQTLGTGIRIYHESFARYIRERMASDADQLDRVVDEVVLWLTSKGMFDDSRAFRWLLVILSDAERHEDVYSHVSDDFVWRSIASGYPSRSILRNLAIAAESAVLSHRIDVAARCLQLANAVHRFQGDQFETLVAYADLQSRFIGVESLAASLLDDGEIVHTGRDGLLICAAIDRTGGVAPWDLYLEARDDQREQDNVSRGQQAEQDDWLAEMRGRLRQLSIDEPHRQPHWDNVANSVEELELSVPRVIEIVRDIYGESGVESLVDALSDPAEALLFIALEFDGSAPAAALEKLSQMGAIRGRAHDLIRAGLEPRTLAGADSLSGHLVDLSHQLIAEARRSHLPAIEEWLDACAVAAKVAPDALTAAEAICQGDGWYRRWLRFVVALSRAEVMNDSIARPAALEALRILDGETNPFVGSPRAVDLYFARDLITSTLQRALRLVNDADLGEAFVILESISDSTSATLMGSVTGPVSPDIIASLVAYVGTRSPLVARQQLESLGADPAGFYGELGRLRLQRARLELALGDEEAAHECWVEALKLLPAYGWHKDTTVEELFGPLDDLIAADASRVRARLGALQSLAERVYNHSDGRGMSYIVERWWRAAAKADPVWVANSLMPVVVEGCNDSLWIPRIGLDGIWREWNSAASMPMAAATALALADLGLASIAELVERFAALEPSEVSDSLRSIMTQVVARADERPVSYSFSNSDELLEADDALVERINQSNDGVGFARVTPRTVPAPPQRDHGTVFGDASRQQSHRPASETSWRLPPGLAGVLEAIAAMRSRNYDAPDDTEWYVNQIGYRLVELSQDGRLADAEAALIALAEAGLYRDGARALTDLSRGFVRAGQSTLAAAAATLAWTRTRANGWHDFGGHDNLDSLKLAFEVDPETALRNLGTEVARAVGRDSIGATRALTIAAAQGLFGPNVDAFALWDKAAQVLMARTPRVSDRDDPYIVYSPLVGTQPQDHDSVTLSTLALAICSPSREEKRRGLVALRWLLVERSSDPTGLLKSLISGCRDTITLTAVLEILVEVGGWCIRDIRVVLHPLADDRRLSVRTLVRLLLDADVSVAAAAPEPRATPAATSVRSLAASAVREYAGARLLAASEIFPGIFSAVVDRAADLFDETEVGSRMRRQLDALASRPTPTFPDAVLAGEQAVEDALQQVGGFARGLMFMAGRGLPGSDWEMRLSKELAPSHLDRVLLESTREPSPRIPEGLPHASPEWGEDGEREYWHEFETGEQWTLVGAVEQRERTVRGGLSRAASRAVGMVRADDPGTSVLFGAGYASDWKSVPLSPTTHLLNVAVPADPANGLGAPPVLLTPSASTWALGNLQPGSRPFSLSGADGEIDVRLVTWRRDYVVNDYELTRPQARGQAVYFSARLMSRVASLRHGLRLHEHIELYEKESI